MSHQQDHELEADAPLRILKHFTIDEEWLLEPGDMLYLPPRLAHWGIAVGPSMTWSIGFRAPSMQELATEFLGYLQERVQMEGMYADPDLHPQRNPAEIGSQMLRKVEAMLRGIRWGRAEVADFLGCYLTEPKPHIVFERPRRQGEQQFRQRLARQGVRLDLKSKMLYCTDVVFINGERVSAEHEVLEVLKRLANQRKLPPNMILPEAVLPWLKQWHAAGYLQFGT